MFFAFFGKAHSHKYAIIHSKFMLTNFRFNSIIFLPPDQLKDLFHELRLTDLRSRSNFFMTGETGATSFPLPPVLRISKCFTGL
jgi:hypothetical protein